VKQCSQITKRRSSMARFGRREPRRSIRNSFAMARAAHRSDTCSIASYGIKSTVSMAAGSGLGAKSNALWTTWFEPVGFAFGSARPAYGFGFSTGQRHEAQLGAIVSGTHSCPEIELIDDANFEGFAANSSASRTETATVDLSYMPESPSGCAHGTKPSRRYCATQM